MSFKKVLALVLTGAMVAGMTCVASADDDVKATVAFASGGWGVQDWASSVAIDGAGTYSIDIAATAEGTDDDGNAYTNTVAGLTVCCVDISGLEDISAYTVTDASLSFDGTVVTDKFIYGDTEEKGNLRIEFYNEYGPTNTDKYASWAGGEFTDPSGIAGTLTGDSFANATATDKVTFTFTLADAAAEEEEEDSEGTGAVAPVVVVAVVAATSAAVIVSKKRA